MADDTDDRNLRDDGTETGRIARMIQQKADQGADKSVPRSQPVDPDTPDDPNIPKDVRSDPKSPFSDKNLETPKTDEDIAREHVAEQTKILKEAQDRMKSWENNYNQSVKDMQKSWAQPDTAPPQPIPLPFLSMQERQP